MRRTARFLATSRFFVPTAVVLSFAMLLGASVPQLLPAFRGAVSSLDRVQASPKAAVSISAHAMAIQAATGPSVQTDRSDYYPGQIVTITGSGWQPGETVDLALQEDPPIDTHPMMSATANDSGNIFNNQFSPDVHDTGITFTLTATGQSSGLQAQTVFTDKPAANLDQCADGPLSTPVPCTNAAWQNGDLNSNQAHYFEGDSVPYRAVLSGLTGGATYTLTIDYDSTQSGKHALDYLTTFNRTETTTDPCTDVSSGGVPDCSSPNTFPIPADTNVTNAGVTQIAGNFTIYNGTITG